MRTILAGISLLFFANLALAQEQIPLDRAQNAAKILTETAAKLTDLQVKIDIDVDKPFGLRKGEIAALAIPDKSLSSDRIAKAGKEIVPVGQLWLKGLTPLVDGNSVPAEKLRIVKVTQNDQSHELPLLLLGVRSKDGKLELVVYAKAKEPLLVLPLEESGRTQEQPIEIEGKGEGETGTLTLFFAGKHQAKLGIGKGQ